MPHPLAPYPSSEARDDELRILTERAGGELRALGHSHEGRPLWAARLPPLPGASEEPPPAARVLVTGNIHGVEFVASRVAMAVIELSLAVPSLRRLRQRAELWVAPCLNPDGYERTYAALGQGRLAELRTNARGVDLNRNFPLPAGEVRRNRPGAGSRHPGRGTYIGEHPLSEPESAALAALLDGQTFVAGVNVHSFLGAIIPPHVRVKAEVLAYRGLCGGLIAAQTKVPYRRLSCRLLDTFTGELEDFQHHNHNMWAVCLETFPLRESLRAHAPGFAPNWFWRFNPRDPSRCIENDVPALAAFLNAALDLRAIQ